MPGERETQGETWTNEQYIETYTRNEQWKTKKHCSGAPREPANGPRVGRGQTGSTLVGSLQISCFLTEGLFEYSRYSKFTTHVRVLLSFQQFVFHKFPISVYLEHVCDYLLQVNLWHVGCWIIVGSPYESPRSSARAFHSRSYIYIYIYIYMYY